MHFLCPQALFLYILVPLFIFLHFNFEAKKKKDVIPFGNMDVLVEAISKTKKIDFLKHLPIILKTLILCTLIFGLARPISTVYLPVKDTKVMLLFDISISMEAEDIKPNRLTAAKKSAIRFIKELPPGIQIGIAFFSGNVKVLANPSFDRKNIISFLEGLDLNKLEPGTAIGDAILAGTEAISINDKNIKSNNNRFLILVTDGEANIGTDPMFSAAQAKVKNVVIQSIGIGNPMGTIIRGGILTRLDEYTLREISKLTGGEYFNAQDAGELKDVYKKIKSSIRLVPEETEITFIPLIISFVLLCILQILRWGKFRFA